MKEFDIKLTALKRLGGEIIRKNKFYATQNKILTQRPMTFELHGSGKVGEVLGMGPAGYLITEFPVAVVFKQKYFFNKF